MIPWWRIVLAFLFCIALAIVAILVVRRRLGTGAGTAPRPTGWLRSMTVSTASPPELLSRLRLSATSQIVVLRWEGTRYLLHASTTAAELLDRRPDAEPAP